MHECPWRARAGAEIVTGGYLHTSRRAQMCLCRVRDGVERNDGREQVNYSAYSNSSSFPPSIVTSLRVLLATVRP